MSDMNEYAKNGLVALLSVYFINTID